MDHTRLSYKADDLTILGQRDMPPNYSDDPIRRIPRERDGVRRLRTQPGGTVKLVWPWLGRRLARTPKRVWRCHTERELSGPTQKGTVRVSNDHRVRDTTIALLQFEKWPIPQRSLAIFEDQESINRKVLARFSDVCEKQFSNLGANRDRITRYLENILQEQP